MKKTKSFEKTFEPDVRTNRKVEKKKTSTNIVIIRIGTNWIGNIKKITVKVNVVHRMVGTANVTDIENLVKIEVRIIIIEVLKVNENVEVSRIVIPNKDFLETGILFPIEVEEIGEVKIGVLDFWEKVEG